MTHRRFLIIVAPLFAIALIALGTTLAFATTVLVNESFSGAQVAAPQDWDVPVAGIGTNVACLSASTDASETPIPGCPSANDSAGSGELRLTAATGNEEGGVAYNLSVPTSQGIDAVFNMHQYGGNGADGIGFFLTAADPSNPVPPTALGYRGGALGYSTSGGHAGMTDGYLGIGFDVFGNYLDEAQDGSGCTPTSYESAFGQVANEISVRGPGSGTAGYCVLDSTAAPGNGGSATLRSASTGTAGRTASAVPAEIVINPTASTITTGSGLSVPATSYEVAFTPVGGSQRHFSAALPTTLNSGLPNDLYPSGWVNPSTGLPYQLNFGWVGSTGGSTDVHEVDQVAVHTVTNVAPPVLTTSLATTPMAHGQTMTYQATVGTSSSGGVETSGITVTDTFPSGVTPLSSGLGGTGWRCSASGQTVTCTFSVTSLAAGSTLPIISMPVTVDAATGDTINDTYTASSNDANPSQASVLSIVVPNASTTTVVSSLNPAKTKEKVTYTATVTSPGGTPTGTVEFEDGGKAISGCSAVTMNSSAVAQCSVTYSSGGKHSISAVYGGTTSFEISTGTVTETVNAPAESSVPVPEVGTSSGADGYSGWLLFIGGALLVAGFRGPRRSVHRGVR